MKIKSNDNTLFTALQDIIPVIPDIPISDILDIYCSNDFKQTIINIIGDSPLNFFYQYYSKSKNKKISSLVETMLESFPLQLYSDYYSLSDLSIQLITNIVEERFSKKWSKLYDTLSFQYNPIKPYDMILDEDTKDELVSHNIDNKTNNRTLNSTDTSNVTEDNNNNSIYGFNSNESVPTDSKEHTSASNGSQNTTDNATNNSTTNYDRTNNTDRVITRQGNIGNTSQQDLVEKERQVWLFQIWDTLFSDLDSVLTRPKYI